MVQFTFIYDRYLTELECTIFHHFQVTVSFICHRQWMQSWWVHLANEPGFEITDWDAANNMPTESSETMSLCCDSLFHWGTRGPDEEWQKDRKHLPPNLIKKKDQFDTNIRERNPFTMLDFIRMNSNWDLHWASSQIHVFITLGLDDVHLT